MTQHSEAIFVFAFRYALNRGTAAPFIVTSEIMKRIDEFNPQCIDQFITDTTHALLHGLCEDLCKYEWASFLDKLLIHRDGKPSIDRFEFLDSRMHLENNRLFRIEVYKKKTKSKNFLYVAKELEVYTKPKEISRRAGKTSIDVYDEIMGEIKRHAGGN